MLKEQPDIAVVAASGRGSILAQGKKCAPDVVLIDVGARSHIGLRVIELIQKTVGEAKMIIMDLAPVQTELVEYVQAGVCGFVLKDATFDDFLNTIRVVAKGGKVLPPTLTESLFSQIVDRAARGKKGNPFTSVRMTKREREVVELIAEGLSNKQIAARLNLAVDTVKSHVHNILAKLALHTRLEIATYAHTARGFKTSSQQYQK